MTHPKVDWREVSLKKGSVYFIWLLAILLIFSNFYTGNSPNFATGNPTASEISDVNVTNRQVYKGNEAPENLAVDQGTVVSGAPSLKVGDRVLFLIQWNIPNLAANSGDYFYIDFPEAEYLSRADVGGNITETHDSSTILATFAAEKANKRIKVTLNPQGASGDFLNQGIIRITDALSKAATPGVLGGASIIISEAGSGGNGGGGGGNDAGAAELPDDQIAFSKDGKIENNPKYNTFFWSMKVGYPVLESLFESSSSASALQMENVVLIDALDEDLVIGNDVSTDRFGKYHVAIGAPLFSATPEGKLSGLSIYEFSLDEYTQIFEPTDGEDMDAFVRRMKAEIETSNFKKIGIGRFRSEDSGNKAHLIIAFGTIGDNQGILYEELYNKIFAGSTVYSNFSDFIEKESKNKNSAVTDEQIRKTQQIYQNREISAFNINLYTTLNPKHPIYKPLYKNKAELRIGNSSSYSNEAVIDYFAAIGSATTGAHPIKIAVQKSWDDGNHPDRPQSVVIRLRANNRDVENSSVTLDSSNLWKHEYIVRRNDSSGQAIQYSVSEDRVMGYQTEISGNAAVGFIVKNTRTSTTTATASNTSATTATPEASQEESTSSAVSTPETTTTTTTTTASSSGVPASSESAIPSGSKTASSADPSETTSGTTSETPTTAESLISTETPSTTVAPTTTSTTSAATATSTAPTTARTFEFIEFTEEIPLGVRTTAPIDLETILIEESIPLGGSLPYTGEMRSELFVGIALLILTVGLVAGKRL